MDSPVSALSCADSECEDISRASAGDKIARTDFYNIPANNFRRRDFCLFPSLMTAAVGADIHFERLERMLPRAAAE